jgi:imidazole glycerol-phosphate synthase subunit HisF
MFRPRVIPVLLLKDRALVKSVRFKKHKYIGDPINAVRIFNELKADELVFLDIEASRNGCLIPLDFVRSVGEEAHMPFSVGGGIRNLDDIRLILAAGAEKVVINTQAGCNPDFVKEASDAFGSSTIVVCIDVKKKLFAGNRAWIRGGSSATRLTPLEFAMLMVEKGVGEIIIQSIDRDGTLDGYDIDLVRSISDSVSVPVIALGGAGTNAHLADCYHEGHANALGAGSLFVYKDKKRGVLINYPEKAELSFNDAAIN